jgi:hypothetical protein
VLWPGGRPVGTSGRFRRHGAGVDDIGVGPLVKSGQIMAAQDKLPLKGLCFVLIDLAAQGINGNFHRESSWTKAKTGEIPVVFPLCL